MEIFLASFVYFVVVWWYPLGRVLVPDGSIQHPGGITLEGKDWACHWSGLLFSNFMVLIFQLTCFDLQLICVVDLLFDIVAPITSFGWK